MTKSYWLLPNWTDDCTGGKWKALWPWRRDVQEYQPIGRHRENGNWHLFWLEHGYESQLNGHLVAPDLPLLIAVVRHTLLCKYFLWLRNSSTCKALSGVTCWNNRSLLVLPLVVLGLSCWWFVSDQFIHLLLIRSIDGDNELVCKVSANYDFFHSHERSYSQSQLSLDYR